MNTTLLTSILSFLDNSKAGVSIEKKEALEIAIQCISKSLNIDYSVSPKSRCDYNLQDIWDLGYKSLLEKHSSELKEIKNNSSFQKHINYLQTTGILNKSLIEESIYREKYNLEAIKFITRKTSKSPISKENNQDKRDYKINLSNEDILKDDHFIKGNELLKQKKFDEAIEEYTLAIEIYAESDVLYLSRATAYYSKGLNNFAIFDCFKSIDINPDDGTPYLILGNIMFNNNKFEKAIENFKEALKYKNVHKKDIEDKIILANEKKHYKDENGQKDKNTMNKYSLLVVDDEKSNSNDDKNIDISNIIDKIGGIDGIKSVIEKPEFQDLAKQFFGNSDPLNSMMGDEVKNEDVYSQIYSLIPFVIENQKLKELCKTDSSINEIVIQLKKDPTSFSKLISKQENKEHVKKILDVLGLSNMINI